MKIISRRESLKFVAGAGLALLSGCTPREKRIVKTEATRAEVLGVTALPAGTTPWPTRDPFLFCVHHHDAYPKGNAALGPAASLAGRDMGQDFAGIDGWRMYHGEVVPGFPSHPHRGFETVTVVRQGLLDHSDSLGAAARYGHGDVQWLTAGAGIQHAEMFPLLHRDKANPVELFQIWLNLPGANKFAKPHFSMLWHETIPGLLLPDAAGRRVEVSVIAGRVHQSAAPSPPPDSWAARTTSDVAIWTLRFDADAEVRLPPAQPGTHRSLYFYEGGEITLGGQRIASGNRIDVGPERALAFTNGPTAGEALLLQGQPIGEPVVSHGPFVMNSREEIHQAIRDYQATGFGGWPWPRRDPVHGAAPRRFARHADGRVDEPA